MSDKHFLGLMPSHRTGCTKSTLFSSLHETLGPLWPGAYYHTICDGVWTRPIDHSKLAIEYCRFRLPRGRLFISLALSLSPRLASRPAGS